MFLREWSRGFGATVLSVCCGVWFLLCGVAGSGFSEDLNNGLEILKKMSEVYRTLESYQFEGTLTKETTAEGFLQRREVPIFKAAVLPDKVRVESGLPKNRVISVSDGKDSWLYFARLQQYSRSTPAEMRQIIERGPVSEAGSISALATKFVDDYGNLAEEVSGVQLLRTEILQNDGRASECYVVEFTDPVPPASLRITEVLPRTLWVEKKDFLVLKDISGSRSESPEDGVESESHQTLVLKRARINEPLPDELFSFVPPEGSKELVLSRFARPRRRTLEGEELTDFTLKDLSGEQVNLKSLRGKVVLLNFWASWCGPCRIEMPVLERLQKEFKAAGLVVLGINDEEPSIALDYLKKNRLTFRSLVDTDQSVGVLYQVRAIPTVIIVDREGKIAFQGVGLSHEAALRDALGEVGISKP
jgi:thiol-disulfide isomerase/thioredoxin